MAFLQPFELTPTTPFENAWRFILRAGLHRYSYDNKTESYHFQPYGGIVNNRHVTRLEKSSFNGVDVWAVHLDRQEPLYAYRNGNELISRDMWLANPANRQKKTA